MAALLARCLSACQHTHDPCPRARWLQDVFGPYEIWCALYGAPLSDVHAPLLCSLLWHAAKISILYLL